MKDTEMLEYARENFQIGEIYDDKDIIEYVRDMFKIEDIFTRDELREWAEKNNYVNHDW